MGVHTGNKEREMAAVGREPRRERDGSLLREEYPVESWADGEYLAVHGPVLLHLQTAQLESVLKVPKEVSIGTGRWNINRLGRFGRNLDTRSGFEGYLIASAPGSLISDLVRVSGRSIAGMLNPAALNTPQPDAWKAVIERNNRRLERIVSNLRDGASLPIADLDFCSTLLNLLIGRLRALPHNTDLFGRPFTAEELRAFQNFRQETAALANAGRYPLLQSRHEGADDEKVSSKVVAVESVWNLDPTLGIRPHVALTRLGLDAPGQLVMDLLQELGRFGHPIVRNAMRTQPQSLFSVR